MKNNRPVIQAMIVALLLAFIGGGWWFNRPQTASLGGEKTAAVSSIRTKASERSAPDPERERAHQEAISQAVQKWYEELLVKYPQLKPSFRDVPDEQNGFLQFLQFVESHPEPKLPEDLKNMLRGDGPWDAKKFKIWMAENKEYCDQILHIAELPDHSIKGLDLGRLANGRGRLSSEFGLILTSAARSAFEDGDRELALRYGKASMSLSNHFTDIEVPSMLAAVIAEGIRASAQESFRTNILPGFSDDPESLASWREVLFRKEAPASRGARILFGEWNVVMREYVLPTLLGDPLAMTGEAPVRIPDGEALIDYYTAATERLAASLSRSGPDRFDLTQSEFVFSESGIDPRTLEMLQRLSFSCRGIFNAIGLKVTETAMLSAAVAIQLGEEPGIDPVSGKPFQWDPESRTLSSPVGVEGHDPIKIR